MCSKQCVQESLNLRPGQTNSVKDFSIVCCADVQLLNIMEWINSVVHQVVHHIECNKIWNKLSPKNFCQWSVWQFWHKLVRNATFDRLWFSVKKLLTVLWHYIYKKNSAYPNCRRTWVHRCTPVSVYIWYTQIFGINTLATFSPSIGKSIPAVQYRLRQPTSFDVGNNKYCVRYVNVSATLWCFFCPMSVCYCTICHSIGSWTWWNRYVDTRAQIEIKPTMWARMKTTIAKNFRYSRLLFNFIFYVLGNFNLELYFY